ncbi:hypothetical protein FOXYS1_3464, partial [Fusarium oxysporum]
MSDIKGGKRSSADADESTRKKAKKDGEDEKYNPYLAHMYDNGNSNGYGAEPSPDSPLA